MKKFLSLFLALAIVLALPVSVQAAPQDFDATATEESIQKYGNVVLDLAIEEITKAGYKYGDVVTVSFLDKSLDVPFVSNYSDVDSGSTGLFGRSADTNLILAVNMGDFATTYGIATKETKEDKSVVWHYADGVTGPVSFKISMKEAGAYYDEYVLHQLSYTSNRADYPHLTDAQFANFRAISTTGIGKNRLYRSASPINPEFGRNIYADAAIKAAGVNVVMNLADDAATAAGYEGYGQTYYSTVKYIPLNMGVDVSAPDFQSKFAEGLRFFANNNGVYSIHCTEGKDRAGFVAAVIECLMGATYDEVIADYMTTFYNYYGVTVGDARYNVIANSNIVKTLQNAFKVTDLKSANLAAEAREYVKEIGLTDAEIDALKANLAQANEPEVMPAPEPAPAPAPAVPSGTGYTVVSGDCLWNIAAKYLGSGARYPEIARLNNIQNASLIYVGQVLTLPAQ